MTEESRSYWQSLNWIDDVVIHRNNNEKEYGKNWMDHNCHNDIVWFDFRLFWTFALCVLIVFCVETNNKEENSKNWSSSILSR